MLQFYAAARFCVAAQQRIDADVSYRFIFACAST
jgi:hypothetical protein